MQSRLSSFIRPRIVLGLSLLAVISVSVPVPGAAAVQVDQEVTLRQAEATAADFIPVLVFLRGRIDVVNDPGLVATRSRSPEIRHALLVGALQERAASTQAQLATALAAAEANSRAHSVRRFWIDNMIGLYASADLITELADRDDIDRIAFLPDAVIDQPLYSSAPAIPGGREPGLDAIGAPAMWALGITGKGRLACGVDTGVRGSHFALANRWRGLTAPWEHAWFDPRGLTSFPQDIGSLSQNHGSHTMGTMVGADHLRGDTVGVAPDAEWIAAYGIGSNALTTLDLIAGLEWAADPDGNPNTTSDVPDVVNGSWRFIVSSTTYPCNDILGAALTNLEAAGVVAIWSAGNEGPSSFTIGYPPNSVNAFGTNFSVGNFNVAADSISQSSSRGPTACFGDTIKPEVVAPGTVIRSCYRANDSLYGPLSGTSMAAPHVSGAVLLLRQLAPAATVAEIKQALFVSAIDYGLPGEDNTYGRGLINIPAAAAALTAMVGGPDLHVELEVVTDNNDTLTAGDTVDVLIRLANRAEVAATNTYLRWTTGDPFVTLVEDSIHVGLVPAHDTASAPAPLRFAIDPAAPEGEPLDITLELAATGRTTTRALVYYTHPEPKPGLFTHDNTLITFTVSNYGQFGVGPTSIYPLGGDGFLYEPSVTDHIKEAALVLGVSAAQVSDATSSAGSAWPGLAITDHDFAVVPGGALVPVTSIGGAFQTVRGIFDDSAAEDPIGVRVTQHSLIFPRGADEGYVMVIFTLENVSAGSIDSLYVGLFNDWDFPIVNIFVVRTDTTAFDSNTQMSYTFDTSQVAAGPYRGVAVLSDPGATAYRSINAQSTLYDPLNAEVLLTDDMKWNYLSGGIGPGSVGVGSFGDAVTFIGTGPFDLPNPGDTVQAAFAFVGSEEGEVRLLLNAQAAQTRYAALFGTGVSDQPSLPRTFTLRQNYPNPFNAGTRIGFSLGTPGDVRLTIYSILGRRVRTLMAGRLAAGTHAATWDGRDDKGKSVGSGIYLYRLEVGEEIRTRKMLLLR